MLGSLSESDLVHMALKIGPIFIELEENHGGKSILCKQKVVKRFAEGKNSGLSSVHKYGHLCHYRL